MAKTTTINGAGSGSGSGSEAKAKTANGRKIKRLAQGFANEQPSRSSSPGLAEGRRWRRRKGNGNWEEKQQRCEASFCFMRNALKIYLNLFHFSSNELRSSRSGTNMARVQLTALTGKGFRGAARRGRVRVCGANGATTTST